jgi:hypothetical protein
VASHCAIRPWWFCAPATAGCGGLALAVVIVFHGESSGRRFRQGARHGTAVRGGGRASRSAQLTPLTERILSRLPGPRFAWIAAWALVPWLNLAMVEAVAAIDQGGAGVTLREGLNRAAVTVAIVLALRGGMRIIADLRRLPPALAAVVEQDEPRWPGCSGGSTAGWFRCC